MVAIHNQHAYVPRSRGLPRLIRTHLAPRVNWDRLAIIAALLVFWGALGVLLARLL